MTLANIATLTFGITALVITGGLGLYFLRFRHHALGVSIAVDMLAEFVAGLFTVLFSFEAVVDWWKLTAGQAVFFRNMIFLALLASSVHLAWQVKKLLHDERNGR